MVGKGPGKRSAKRSGKLASTTATSVESKKTTNQDRKRSLEDYDDDENSQKEEECALRDLDHLYCHIETYNCAMRLCVPCAYKIGNFNSEVDPHFVKQAPNQRPENCPRIKTIPTEESLSSSVPVRTFGYHPGMHVLTCGDGDFSFSLAVARILFQAPNGPSSKLVATSYENHDTLIDVYPTLVYTLKEVVELGSHVLYNVDATNLKESLSQEAKGLVFHRIVWNFPCTAVARGQDGQNEAMEENKDLIRRFVVHARPFLADGGEIHICHKTKPPYNQWKLEEVVSTACNDGLEYNYLGRIVLDRAILPPYIPRKALDKKSFPCHDACMYVFGLKTSREGKFQPTISSDDETLLPLTARSVVKVRNAHLIKARYDSYKDNKKGKSRKKQRKS